MVRVQTDFTHTNKSNLCFNTLNEIHVHFRRNHIVHNFAKDFIQEAGKYCYHSPLGRLARQAEMDTADLQEQPCSSIWQGDPCEALPILVGFAPVSPSVTTDLQRTVVPRLVNKCIPVCGFIWLQTTCLGFSIHKHLAFAIFSWICITI